MLNDFGGFFVELHAKHKSLKGFESRADMDYTIRELSLLDNRRGNRYCTKFTHNAVTALLPLGGEGTRSSPHPGTQQPAMHLEREVDDTAAPR